MKRFTASFYSATILLGWAFFGSGCGSPVNSVEPAQPHGQREMVADKRILNDPRLSVRARVVGVNQASTPGGLVRVQVELQNDTRSVRDIQYRWEWFDANGMLFKTATGGGWESVQLEGKESKFIGAVAPSPTCQDFRLKLQRP